MAMEISLNNFLSRQMKSYRVIKNIPLMRAVSQIFNLGPSFYFIQQTFNVFSKYCFSKFHKTETHKN